MLVDLTFAEMKLILAVLEEKSKGWTEEKHVNDAIIAGDLVMKLFAETMKFLHAQKTAAPNPD